MHAIDALVGLPARQVACMCVISETDAAGLRQLWSKGTNYSGSPASDTHYYTHYNLPCKSLSHTVSKGNEREREAKRKTGIESERGKLRDMHRVNERNDAQKRAEGQENECVSVCKKMVSYLNIY